MLNGRLQQANDQLTRQIAEVEAANNDLANLLASTDIATLFLDRELRVRLYTPAIGRLLPLVAADIGRPLLDLGVRPCSAGLVDDALLVLSSPAPTERELTDGSFTYLRRVTPYRTRDDGSAGVVVTWTDISARRRHELALTALNVQLEQRVAERTEALERQAQHVAEQQRLLQTVLSSIADGVMVFDRADRVLIENPAAVRLVGHPSRGATAPWADAAAVFGPTVLADASPTQAALAGCEVHGIEMQFADGQVVVEVGAAPFRDESGEVIGVVATLHDITARQRAAAAEARLAALVRSARAAVIAWDGSGVVTEWNEGAERMFGFTAAEIRGHGLDALAMAGERRGLSRALGAGTGALSVADRELVMRHKDGHAVHVAWTAAPIRDAHGRVVGAAAVGADISARALVERQVAMIADEQRQQLGRELHDTLGQQLTAIGLLASSLADMPSPDLLAMLETSIDAAKSQLRVIVKGLAPVEVDAAGLVIALDELAEYTRQAHGVDCRVDCPEPVDAGDNFTANQLYLIAREAVHNAVKHASPQHVVIRLQQHGDGLYLSIEDDGSGMAEREPTSGGMGLRIMGYRARIVGGDLGVARREGGGTVLSCRLGRTDSRETAAPP